MRPTEDDHFNIITSSIPTCRESAITITQSATIQAAVARYDKFRLYDNNVQMLTHYNTGNQATERDQAEQCPEGEGRAEQWAEKKDQAGHNRVGGRQAEQQHTGDDLKPRDVRRAEHQLRASGGADDLSRGNGRGGRMSRWTLETEYGQGQTG